MRTKAQAFVQAGSACRLRRTLFRILIYFISSFKNLLFNSSYDTMPFVCAVQTLSGENKNKSKINSRSKQK